MKDFAPDEFNRFVIDNDVIGFFVKPIKLKSGRESNWYVNWRTVVEDAFLLNKLSDYVLSFTHQLVRSARIKCMPDSFYGVPEGATKLGLITQFKFAASSPSFAPGSHAMPMGRGKPKDHGVPKDRFFVGEPRGKTIVLEDVTTTGGSLEQTLKQLEEAGIEVLAAFGLTNRMEKRDDGRSVSDALSAYAPYFALSSATDLLPEAATKKNIPLATREAIEKEFKEFGLQPLTLT